MLEVQNVSFRIGKRLILDTVSTSFLPGNVSMIIGPNGSGKSTLLKIISNELKRYSGSISYGGKILTAGQHSSLAKRRAVLAQHSELSFPLTVEEVVMMGRYPHFKVQPTAHDQLVVNQVLEELNMTRLRFQNYLTLSGGEKQKTHFARALAQIREVPVEGCRYLLLDEPIASLDLNYQHEFLRMARLLASDNIVVVAVIHDLNLALQYADHIVALHHGKVIADNKPQQVITPSLIDSMYGLKSRILHTDNLPFPILVTNV